MLHEVVTARNQILRKNLGNQAEKNRNNGTIILTAEENQGNKDNEMIEFEMRATFQSGANSADQVFFILSRFVSP